MRGYGSGGVGGGVGAVGPAGEWAVIVDDVLATGGTARAACDLVGMLGAEAVGAVFLMELEALGGRAVVAPVPVRAVISYA